MGGAGPFMAMFAILLLAPLILGYFIISQGEDLHIHKAWFGFITGIAVLVLVVSVAALAALALGF